MKALSRLMILMAAVAVALCSVTPAAFGASRLIYSDEFNGPLDTMAWTTALPWGSHHPGVESGELQEYDPANTILANGIMKLVSNNNAQNGYAYTSGIVSSFPRDKFSYGYFELRAKLPEGRGIWPSFWLVADSPTELEIDIMEVLGDHPNRIWQVAHLNHSQTFYHFENIENSPTDFHTYGADWQPTYTKWYIDGVLTGTHNATTPPDPVTICINTAIGGWAGPPSPATVFPVSFDIDYLRVYDKKPKGPLTISPNKTVNYGASTKAGGVLYSSTGTAMPGQPIALFKSYNGSTWTKSADATTSASGTYSFALIKPSRKTYYQTRFDGGLGSLQEFSRRMTVRARPYVSAPKAPKTMRRSRYYTVYGHLKPRHKSGTYPVRIYRYKKTKSGKWKRYGYVKARARNYRSYTKYYKKLKLTSKGRWRLRAYAPADSRHATRWSSKYDYVTVK